MACDPNPASPELFDFIYRHSGESPAELQSQFPFCMDFPSSNYAIFYLPLSEIVPLSIDRHTYNGIPKLYTLLDTSSLEDSGILAASNQPALNLRGQGVLMGFIDTGIDYTNPYFRSSSGNTRILSIWDQSIEGPGIPGENAYQTINYGTEFTREQINEALGSENPYDVVPSRDANGHGTFLTGIAAASPSPDGSFQGAAPESELVIVKLKPAKPYLRDFFLIPEDADAYQENDIMMGIKYLELCSYKERKPLVIFLGLGTNSGSHEGSSPLGNVLRTASHFLGVIPVVAAGNEAGRSHHFMGKLENNQNFQDVEIRVAEGERGFVAELWALNPEIYTVGFISPSGENIERIPIVLGKESEIRFLLEPTVITVNYQNTLPGSGNQLIFMRFQAPTAGVWRIRVYNNLFLSGTFHIWLPAHGLISPETVFLNPNPYTTITEPGNSTACITAGAYDHKNGSIYIHSSRGYNLLNQVKPDLTAPGVNLTGPGVPPPAAFASGRDISYPTVTKSGTSIAAAITAGAVANLLTWGIISGNQLALDSAAVRSFLIRGAQRSPAYSYPNQTWGYGTLDLYQSFLALRES